MTNAENFGTVNYINDVFDGRGNRVVKEFLVKLFDSSIEHSIKYMDAISEAPYAYGEKQIHSIIAPALSKVTDDRIGDTFLMERPIERRWSKKKKLNMADSHGWLDYWCRYRNVDFFIEVKHNYDSFRTENIRAQAYENWRYMNNEQLGVVRSEAKRYSQYCKGVILVSFHVFTIYENIRKTSEPKSIENKKELIEIQKRYYERLNPKPNWSALWIVKRDYVEKSKTENGNQNEYYSGLMIMVNVSEII